MLGTASALGWLGNRDSPHRVRAAVIAALTTVCGGDLASSVLAEALNARWIAQPIVRSHFFQVILIVAVAAGPSRRLPPEGSARIRERRRLTLPQRAMRRFSDDVDRLGHQWDQHRPRRRSMRRADQPRTRRLRRSRAV